MDQNDAILFFGFDKNGEADFGASCAFMGLSFKQMQELRAMIPVGISQAEQLFMMGVQKRSPMAAETKPERELDE